MGTKLDACLQNQIKKVIMPSENLAELIEALQPVLSPEGDNRILVYIENEVCLGFPRDYLGHILALLTS